MDIHAKMQEYRASGATDPLNIWHGREIKWRAFGLTKGMKQAEVDSIQEATLQYNMDVPDPSRPGLQRLEILLKNDDDIFRLYPGAPPYIQNLCVCRSHVFLAHAHLKNLHLAFARVKISPTTRNHRS